MKIYTCTPVRFRGGDIFFSRDSGLLCKGLSMLGVETRALLPGPPIEDKDPLLWRVPYAQLESSDFWRSLSLDGLILYSWAAPRYYPIAQALRQANVPFLVNVDSSGLVSKLANDRLWSRDVVPYLIRSLWQKSEWRSSLSGLVDNYFGIHRVAKARLKTIEAATVTTAVTPLGALWLQEEVTRLGRSDLSNKIQYLPHPQPDDFAYSGCAKEKIVVSVARWERRDWLQKNPKLLLRSLAIFLERLPDWKAVVIGRGATQLVHLLRMDTGLSFERVEFADFLPMADIKLIYNRAMIGLWVSRGEGQIGAGAQALCCGCSVVAPNLGTLSCFSDYVTRQSGRLALSAHPQDVADALMLEAQDWEKSHRSPSDISAAWYSEFAAGNVAQRALTLLGLETISGLQTT
jgi:glycosyltransferase involved in cell wall biosynthesis